MEFVILLILGSILLFALLGFIASIRFLFFRTNSGNGNNLQAESARPNLKSDVLAARRLLEHLHLEKHISDAQFSRLGHFLDDKFPGEISESPYQSHRSIPVSEGPESQLNFKGAPGEKIAKAEPPLAGLMGEAVDRTPISRDDQAAPDRPIVHPEMSDAANSSEFQDLARQIISQTTPPTTVPTEKLGSQQSVVSPHAVPGNADAVLDAELVETLAPWDQPDPPVRPERRSFGEMVAGFMQENNMRWGELASGILIVLSAIGLVVSLRNELNQRIPYFSSMLFLLITAAIIGAGIYTLRRWKLRNTSRGTLIIGLLLIPINFVAACVLSSGENRRELSDPLYWTAVIVGLVAFGFLSWYGTRFLFRKFNLGLTLALVGSGACSLVYHRLAENASIMSSSPKITLALLPVGTLMLWAANFFHARSWNRSYRSQRGSNRWMIETGIAAFAAIAAGSIWILQTRDVFFTTLAISPLLIIVSLMLASMGHSIMRFPSRDLTSHRPVIGSTLLIFGLFLAAVFWFGSLGNPIVFAINSSLVGISCGAFGLLRGLPDLMPLAWGALALCGLAGINLYSGQLPFDQWVKAEQIHGALFNGKSGIFLLICGSFAAGIQSLVSTRLEDTLASQFRRSGLLAGCVIILLGSAVAMIASVLNRDSYFDTMTASALAVFAGLGTTVISIFKNRQRDLLDANDRQSAFIEFLPAIRLALLALILMLIGLMHAFLWNLFLAEWLVRITYCREATWAWIFAIHGLVFAIASRIDKPGADNDVIVFGSALSLIAATLAAIVIVPLHSGNSTVILCVTAISWFVIGLTQLRNAKHCVEATHDAAVPFAAATGVLTSVAAAEWVLPPAWGDGFGVRHVMIQAVSLSAWAVAWTVLAIVLPRYSKARWLVAAIPRVEQVVLPHVVALIAGVLIGALADASGSELFRDFFHASLLPNINWVCGALIAMWIAVSLMILQQPSWIKGGSLITLWFLAWAIAATQFEESRAAASALRWLVPGGGLVLAIFVGQRRRWLPAWVGMRRALRFKGRSWWHRRLTQRLIDFSVLIGVGVALIISTITVSQVMLNGPTSLGGPTKGSFFAGDKLISFGVPLVLVVSMLLSYAVTERRPYLAGMGSMIFQYLVILATFLFVISAANPGTKLANDYFIKVLHSSAIGMTLFGFAWYWFRKKIHWQQFSGSAILSRPGGDDSTVDLSNGMSANTKLRVKSLELHTLINGLLLIALSAAVIVQYYLAPDQPAGWLSSIGNPIGLLSVAGFAMLASLLGSQVETSRSMAGRMWMFASFGMMLVGFAAAASEHFIQPFQPWLALRVICWGFILLGTILLGNLWRLRLLTYAQNSELATGNLLETDSTGSPRIQTGSARNEAIATMRAEHNKIPFLISMFASLVFAIRGLDTSSWSYETIIQLLVIVGLIFGGGVVLRRAWLLFASGATAMIAASVMDERGLLPTGQPAWLNLSAIWLCLLGVGNVVAERYLKLYRGESLPPRFTSFASVAGFVTAIWILCGSLFEIGIRQVGESCLHNRLGLTVFFAAFALLFVFLWTPHRRLWTASFALITVGLSITVALIGHLPPNWFTLAIILFAVSLTVLFWGVSWGLSAKWMPFFNRLGAPDFGPLKRSMQGQLPVFGMGIASLLLPTAFVCLVTLLDQRLDRMTVASVPILLAVGLGCFSNAWNQRWLQHAALILATIGLVFVSWAELATRDIWENPVQLLLRTLIVLALAMFVYGGVLTRFVQKSDHWLKTFKEMSGLTCGAAIVCLAALVGYEWANFDPVSGSGIRLVEALTVVAVGLGMVYGLITIAIRPQHDPFSFSMEGRQAYVYLAQIVLAGLVTHLFLSMPWLFQWGLKEYWPYLAMAVCFGGVGFAKILEKRGLEVLTQPLFNTAATIPIVTSIAYFALSSQTKADGATLMLVAGLAYLVIGLVHESMAGRILALVFGNLALWLFYGRFENFSFYAHPQLWLIPPAFSALIAAQLNRNNLQRSQLATVRYVSAAVIYVSSTSEIFISGIGNQLWPPMVLALLSVLGIMAGIMVQVRAFLYFGVLFLLMAMISMVSHAHRRFDHVWPWWAFGIVMGIGILVMFGLFEKRKNDLKRLANQLKEWDA